MQQIQFTFSLEQANLILKALDNLPYGEVHQLVQNIHEQATPQLNEGQANRQEPEQAVLATETI